jgi:prevent-host-death family protein
VASVNIRDLRGNLRELVERAEAGEEITIVRRGKQVARLMPPAPEFRASIKLKGEPLSQTVIRQRREARY